MKKDYKVKLGRLGERLAEKFLKRNGCEILERNFYTRYGEIDLIVRDGEDLVFIEVKARTSNRYGYPEQAVDSRKVQNLFKAIQIYLRDKRLEEFWRLDVVSVELSQEARKANIRRFKDVGRV